MKVASFFTLASSILVVGLAIANNTSQPQSNDKLYLDKDFVAKIAAANYGEIKLSELAVKSASSQKVRDFAKHMIAAHQDLGKKLDLVAGDQKAVVMPGTEKEAKEACEKLSSMKAAQFDREFMKIQINDHQKVIRLFETEVSYGKDARIRLFAENNLPEVRKHLTEATAIQDAGFDK